MLAAFIAFGYALILAYLPIDAFKDREAYLAYAEGAAIVLARNLASGPLYVLANEPVWLLANTGLGAFFAAEDVVRVFIFGPSLVLSFLLLRNARSAWPLMLLLLLHPMLLQFHIVHLRQGVAVSLFMYGWYCRGWRRHLFLGAAPFIHASYFFILVMMAIDRVSDWLGLRADTKLAVFFAYGVAIALLAEAAANTLGARQGSTITEVSEISGLGFVFWLTIAAIYLAGGQRFLERNAIVLGAIIVYLVTYFTIGISARIFVSMLPLVALAGMQLSGWRWWAFVLCNGAFLGVSWATRIGSPGMGFAPG